MKLVTKTRNSVELVIKRETAWSRLLKRETVEKQVEAQVTWNSISKVWEMLRSGR